MGAALSLQPLHSIFKEIICHDLLPTHSLHTYMPHLSTLSESPPPSSSNLANCLFSPLTPALDSQLGLWWGVTLCLEALGGWNPSSGYQGFKHSPCLLSGEGLWWVGGAAQRLLLAMNPPRPSLWFTHRAHLVGLRSRPGLSAYCMPSC